MSTARSSWVGTSVALFLPLGFFASVPRFWASSGVKARLRVVEEEPGTGASGADKAGLVLRATFLGTK